MRVQSQFTGSMKFPSLAAQDMEKANIFKEFTILWLLMDTEINLREYLDARSDCYTRSSDPEVEEGSTSMLGFDVEKVTDPILASLDDTLDDVTGLRSGPRVRDDFELHFIGIVS